MKISILLALLIGFQLNRMFFGVQKAQILIWFEHWLSTVRGYFVIPKSYHQKTDESFDRSSLKDKIVCITIVFAAMSPVVLVAILGELYIQNVILHWVWQVFWLYILFHSQGIIEEAQYIEGSIMDDDLDSARHGLRDMGVHVDASLNEEGIIKTTIETILRKSTLSIFGLIFWFVLAGVPGILLYRFMGVLGEQSKSFDPESNRYNWFAEHFFEILDFLPTRLAAFSFVLTGRSQMAWRCWQKQAKHHWDINSGVLLATGAGALGVRIGGDEAICEGVVSKNVTLGTGRSVSDYDISRALRLMMKAIFLWGSMIAIMYLLY